MRFVKTSLAILLSSQCATALANDLDHAPPSFDAFNEQAVPVDFRHVETQLTFKKSGGSFGVATIEFDAGAEGLPIFDLIPEITSISIDGTNLAPQDAPEVSAPTGVTKVRVLKHRVQAGSRHTLTIGFKINYGNVSTTSADVGFFMDDLGASGRGFWEQYAPSNIEFDQFAQRVQVKLEGWTNTHVLMANGVVSSNGLNEWTIDYPEYFTTSSFYLHFFAEGKYKIATGQFSGIERSVPVTVYAESQQNATTGLARSKEYMAELESTFGPYAHDSVTVYVTPNGGGMEHVGATVTSLWALSHELTHSWFARGVMPSTGNSGWMDEAIASWHDDDYPRASSAPNRSPVNLGGFSPWRRHTTQAAYSEGETLISEMDYMFRTVQNGNKTGMKAILSDLYDSYKRKTITVERFKSFIEEAAGTDLTAIFRRYVYGQSTKFSDELSPLPRPYTTLIKTNHPRPFTKEEREKLQ